MSGALSGFGVIFLIVGAGYLVARSRLLGEHAVEVLSRLVFYLAMPVLLFNMLAKIPVSEVFSSELAVAGAAVAIVAAVYFAVVRVLWRRDLTSSVIGVLAAAYANSTILGIPIAVFVLGGPEYVTPLALFQMVVFQPIALMLLGMSHAPEGSRKALTALRSFANPILVGAILGIVVSASHVRLPDFCGTALTMLGAMAVPSSLLVFGMSFVPTETGNASGSDTSRRDVWLAVVVKSFLYPVVAYLLGAFLFQLSDHALLAAVVLAALPSAQMVYVISLRYQRAQKLARDTTLITTLLSIPVVILIAWLLG